VSIALYETRASIYDSIYASKDYRGEAVRWHRLARRALGRAPRSLLDVACGTGRHLEEFRRLVGDVAGIDRSATMLRLARRRLGRGVRLVRGDMRSFDLGRSFDVVTCLFSAFGYLTTPADRAAALAAFHRHLAPGGVLLVEGWVLPARWKDGHVSLQTHDSEEVKVARVGSTRRQGSISVLEMDYLVGRPGRRVEHFREQHRMALVGSGEVLLALRAAGFRGRALFPGRDRSRALYLGVRSREPPLSGARRGGARSPRRPRRASSKAF
jgi:SAM-dependent methyltransferase